MRFIVAALTFLVLAASAQAQSAETEDWLPPTTAPDAEPDAPAEKKEPRIPEWGVEGPYTFDIALMLGTGRRLDDPPLYDVTQRQGLLYGGGFDVSLSRHVSIGAHYEHFDLGEEDSGLQAGGLVLLTRDLNSFFGVLRLYPVRGDDAGLYLRIGLGAAWQSVNLVGELIKIDDPSTSVALECEGSDSFGFGLRGDAGVDLELGGGARWQVGAGVDAFRLQDELLSSCAPGAGTATVFSIRSAFVYGWGF